jgi:hypothetical protein
MKIPGVLTGYQANMPGTRRSRRAASTRRVSTETMPGASEGKTQAIKTPAIFIDRSPSQS